MDVNAQIDGYLAAQPEPKRGDMHALHELLSRVMPGTRRWFVDGTDETGRTITNPSIGYGLHTIAYADVRTREWFQVGLSANTGGISVYVMGLEDRTYLPRTYGATLGKAKVTGYCIRFRALRDVDLGVLEAAIRDGVARTSP